ncbi:hypothetical protein [Streptomyces sp. NBC_01565]|uniref:hypothetical protein n=1 Tax=unclassified Streptomyces TaxID=2593676 RepID=UPI00224CF9CF|nr:hypothetical protein [Streptomyces sp. NBC_01565]MCX4545940.1 hypothetical protein [Streptomyces sp. NBC_01565]
MKKYLLAATVAVAAMVIGTPSAQALARTDVAQKAPAPKAVPHDAAPRVVLPGERVDAGKGWTVWLTRDGKHWTGPDDYENFRSVTDGNLDFSEPGVSHQSESDAADAFRSGVFYGTRKAARVELTDSAGKKTTARLLELPGRPDWGVWYAHTPSEAVTGAQRVALYDRAGKLLAELPARDF